MAFGLRLGPGREFSIPSELTGLPFSGIGLGVGAFLDIGDVQVGHEKGLVASNGS